MHVVPWNYDYSKEDYDGLFISNGPGDPSYAKSAVDTLRKVICHLCSSVFADVFVFNLVQLLTTDRQLSSND